MNGERVGSQSKTSAEAKLAARRAVIEHEMAHATYHRSGTVWGDERVAEIKLIERRLRK